ncbi:putative golgi associated, gamma adaptin ear containing,arf binding protein 1 (gga1) [Schistosoma mansoni]|uniref:putative golgi associated, gamma adaptin ear containing,arf binding protein 1 (gga1) n=1 Tax=Schistosoma mansoni TaxID=6183 RepID=UPI00022DC5B9|nr:putative golgi associated, gamma adaptin ear containing,arf binding protein 1 (gga1) [Schistosoma mansoni]|eukprot:XP_018653453.1 putative golgi associated, gamma adaptin ear containing,arf binding protein 1 (gga1) [Schistosoma mansoni]
MNELEKLLSKATNPISDQYDSDTVNEISKLIDTQPNGPVFTLRLLAHKIKSPHEKEALSSLVLLEFLSKRCGPTFISELGKFKFLNELIKVLSPKYLGDQTSSCVKNKCAQLLHNWQRDFSPNEPKFAEAYNMLVREGIITASQIVSTDSVSEVCRSGSSAAENRQNIFERNKKSERLTQLLRSRNPADLREANALIKSIVEEDQVRMEKVSQRTSEMEALRNNTILLEEMIGTYLLGESTEAELELMNELVQNIRRARPLLYSFSLTHEEQDIETLTEIGQICDKASEVLANYEQKIANRKSSSSSVKHGQPHMPSSITNDHSSSSLSSSSNHVPDLLTQDLMNLGLNDDPITPITSSNTKMYSSDVLLLNTTDSFPVNHLHNTSCHRISHPIEPKYSLNSSNNLIGNNSGIRKKSNYDDLQDIFSTNTTTTTPTTTSGSTNTPTSNHNHKVEEMTSSEVTSQNVIDLKSFDIQLSSVQPHSIHKTPLTLYPTNLSQENDSSDNTYNIQLTLHYTNNKPHPDVMVFVAVISSRNVLPITEINVRFGVEKPFKIRQLIASGQNLPAYTTFLPPASISQVLLIYNPSKLEKFILKFQLSFILDSESILESGKLDLPCG